MKWYWWLIIAAGVALLIYIVMKAKDKKDLKEVTESQSDKNVQAFLKVLRFAEGTAASTGYRTLYGGKLFNNTTDHPTNTGEWMGAVLPDKYCIGAGLKPGCKSTAAGAYQFIRPTWNALKAKLELKDFGEQSQDLAAIELIRAAGALDAVKAGDLKTAFAKVAKTWASIPGSTSGQPQKKAEQLTAVFLSNQGKLNLA